MYWIVPLRKFLSKILLEGGGDEEGREDEGVCFSINKMLFFKLFVSNKMTEKYYKGHQVSSRSSGIK